MPTKEARVIRGKNITKFDDSPFDATKRCEIAEFRGNSIFNRTRSIHRASISTSAYKFRWYVRGADDSAIHSSIDDEGRNVRMMGNKVMNERFKNNMNAPLYMNLCRN